MKKYVFQCLCILCFPLLCQDIKEFQLIKPDSSCFYSFNKFCMGVDLSYVNQIEDMGGIYKESGVKKDPFLIFRSHGANTVRVRLWHNPDWYNEIYQGEGKKVYSNLIDASKTIKKAKDLGMAVNLDFHYSDTWADPGHQNPPKAWKNITGLDVLKDSVYRYTYKTLIYLERMNIMPEMVQIGNEINCGMMITHVDSLFPDLNGCNGYFQSLGEVLNSGIRAVRDASENSVIKPEIILHIADPNNLEWWFENITENGKVTDFNIIGFSYYFQWHTAIPFNKLPGLIKDIKYRFRKKIMIVETAYPYTTENSDEFINIFGTKPPLEDFPYTVKGQYDYMVSLTQNVINAGGCGVIYWEPAWISSEMKDLWGKGSSWENNTFFDFEGNVIPSIDFMTYPYKFPDNRNKNENL